MENNKKVLSLVEFKKHQKLKEIEKQYAAFYGKSTNYQKEEYMKAD